MPNVQDFAIRVVPVPVNIANGAALSAEVDLGGCSIVAISMPAAWTTAPLTFQHSPYDATDPNFTQFNELWKSPAGNNSEVVYEISSTGAAQGQTIIVPEADFAGLRFLKVRSGTVGVPVNQGAARTIVLLVRPVL